MAEPFRVGQNHRVVGYVDPHTVRAAEAGVVRRGPLGDFAQRYGLDLELEPQKDAVIKQFDQFKESLDEERLTPILRQAAGGINFYNHSFFDCVD